MQQKGIVPSYVPQREKREGEQDIRYIESEWENGEGERYCRIKRDSEA